MKRKFNLSVWIFSSIVVGFLFGGGMALAEGANLWPLTAILGGVVGLIVGAILGVILKLIKLPMKYAWFIFGLVLVLATCVRIYIKHYYKTDFGKIVEATIVECEASPHFYTPPYRNIKDRKEINGVDLTLNVTRERRLGKFQDWRIKVYEWRLANRTRTYFMEDASCESMVPGEVIYMRTKDYGLDYEYVYRIHWGPETISREGRFIIGR